MSRHHLPFSPCRTPVKPPSLPASARLLIILASLSAALSVAAQTTNQQAQIEALNAEKNDASQQVEKIVNQLVVGYIRQPGMDVARYPYWFHPGANTPDFNHVDIRTTQEFPYAKFEYVASDLNPNMVFRGRDLEFNANTKLFYTNRSLPKKKLTEADMLEINRLYRIIGRCEQQLAQINNPAPTQEATSDDAPETTPEKTAGAILTRFPILKSNTARVVLVVVGLLGIVYLFRRRSE